MDTSSKRIEWIDLAKGICIVLVVWWHIKELYSNRGFTDRSLYLYMANYFRMPLYFLLSGLFFKTYSGYWDFLLRKFNKLFVPFAVFALLGVAYCLLLPHKLPAQRTWESFYPFVVVWFLWCLFVMNNLFYLLVRLCRGDHLVLYISVALIGIIGYYSGDNVIGILHLQSALTALPFFVIGFALRQHTNWLYYKARWWEWLTAAVALVGGYLLVLHLGKGGIYYVHNRYEIPIWALYGGGLLGIYALLTVARLLKHVPIISYLGRYSIIVLITHYPLVYLVPKQWNRILFEGHGAIRGEGGFEGYCAAMELVLLLLAEVPIIWLCKKYLPWIFAQKDLVKFKKH